MSKSVVVNEVLTFGRGSLEAKTFADLTAANSLTYTKNYFVIHPNEGAGELLSAASAVAEIPKTAMT